MANEPFNGEIEPGGLRDINDIKILICYLLKNAGQALTFDNLNDILQHDGLCNYFKFGQSLHELLETGHLDLISRDGTEYYKVTRLGAGTADMFERRLPFSVREKAVKAAIRLLARLRVEAENKVTINKGDNGYTVECRVMDGKDELMAIRLLVADSGQADAVKRQFLKDPETVYRGALALMTGDVSAIGGILKSGESGH